MPPAVADLAPLSPLDRVLDPLGHSFSAEAVLRVRFTEQETARYLQLSELAGTGTLTEEEDRELKAFVEAADLLAILQSKARRSLGAAEAAGGG